VVHGDSQQDDESFGYDANGNRTTEGTATYVTGDGQNNTPDNNQMTSDGTHHYAYDANGNREYRFTDDGDDVFDGVGAGDTDITRYYWDYRNRLVKVSEFDDHADATGGTGGVGTDATYAVEFIYDSFNNRIAKIVDADGDDTGAAVCTDYRLLDGELYLEFNEAVLSHRYIPGRVSIRILRSKR